MTDETPKVPAPFYDPRTITPSSELYDDARFQYAAAKDFIDSSMHRHRTIQEQSMDWARDMAAKVGLEKEQAVVQALITAMIATGSDVIRVQPQHAIDAVHFKLHRHTDPATGDWIIKLIRKGA